MKAPTVQMLNRQFSKLGLPVSGKKVDLLDRLRNHQMSTEDPASTEDVGT
jgi:hypothetical protein